MTRKTGSTDDATGSEALHEDGITLHRVEELVGKEIAQKIADSVGEHIGGAYREWRELKNVDLKVGGEGMKAFYDKIVPSVAKDVVRKLGGKVEPVLIALPETRYAKSYRYEGPERTIEQVRDMMKLAQLVYQQL